MINLLETKNLSLNIANKTLCRELHLQIKPGDRWGILGANGSGKTTLLHALAKLHPISTGEIFLQQKNIASLSAKTIAQQLGILFQDSHTSFSQSVFEFCLAGRHPHLSHFAWESAADKQITQQALMAMDLHSLSAQNIHSLSGGERKRLALACLLTQSPQLYLLDEPINHLDIYHQVTILQHFKQLTETQPVSIILSLHDMNIAEHYCNKILMLFGDGETLQGSPDMILTENNLKRLYQHPLKAISQNNQRYWLPEFNHLF